MRNKYLKGKKLDSTQMEDLLTRIDNIEKRDKQEIVALVEILSNVTFFGGIKKTNCEHAKNGQCSLFHLQKNARNKIPIATECRISECNADHDHCHLEISNITCTFCPQWNNNQIEKSIKQNLPRSKNKRQGE